MSGQIADGAAGWAERDLIDLWLSQRFDRSALIDGDGAPLSVVFRGWPNRGPGPDFREAILADSAGRLIRGDIEVHVRASDWWAHGHHRDPAYDRVVVHLVGVSQGAVPVELASGEQAPTIVLPAALPAAPWSDAPPDICRETAAGRSPDELLELLDRAGDQRLQAKADRFEGDLAARDPGDVLLAAVCEALGYSANSRPFRRLAERIPAAVLEAYCAGKPAELAELLIEAILLKAAGFWPDGRRLDPAAATRLARLEAAAGRDRLSAVDTTLLDWTRRGVRPDNTPPRRISGAARLIVRTHRSGLVAATLAALRTGDPPAAAHALEDLFAVGAEGFWSARSDWLTPIAPAALIGRDRARAIVVDVALPFAIAIAPRINEPGLIDRALAVFAEVPRLAENQTTRRLIDQLDADRRLRRRLTARRQQGLIHLWRTSCEHRLCERCPIAGSAGAGAASGASR